jgi:hypothetical protein
VSELSSPETAERTLEAIGTAGGSASLRELAAAMGVGRETARRGPAHDRQSDPFPRRLLVSPMQQRRERAAHVCAGPVTVAGRRYLCSCKENHNER